MRPVSSSSTTEVRGPRLRNSSTTPAMATGLPPKKRGRPRRRLRPVGLEIVGDAAGDETRQVVHEAIDGMAADRASQRFALAAQAHACRSTPAGPARWRAPPRARAQSRDRRCRAGRFRSPWCSARRAQRRVEAVHERGAVRREAVETAGRISASSTRRLSFDRSSRRHRSSRLAKSPFARRSLTMAARPRPRPRP